MSKYIAVQLLAYVAPINLAFITLVTYTLVAIRLVKKNEIIFLLKFDSSFKNFHNRFRVCITF